MNRAHAVRDSISVVLFRRVRAETSGNKTGSVRDDRETERQDQREDNHTLLSESQ